MNSVCANCPHPAFCEYQGLCSPKRGRPVESASFANAADDVRKATPIDAIFKFWPDAMVALAQHIWKGNERYSPNHPVMEWKRELSSDHPGSLMRHMVDYFLADSTEGRVEAMTAVAWRAMAQLQLLTEEKGDE